MYAEVLVEYSAKSIDKTFTYIIPEILRKDIKVGMKVLVPFGSKKINGFVTKIVDNHNSSYELKEISSIIDKHFCLNDELMKLGSFLQSKTLCTKITAYQTMLPSSLKVKEQKTNYSKYLTYIKLNKSKAEVEEYINKYPRRIKQIDILKKLLLESKILKNTFSSATLNVLFNEKIICEE